MPDAAVLARMYGPSYAADATAEASVEDPKSPERVVAFLQKRRHGVFVDFGCGSGTLLTRVAAVGWTTVGVEYDAAVASATAARTGSRVFDSMAGLRAAALPVDVVNLGDVIEHLTEPLPIVRELVALLRPGGWLVAEGPLEAGPCLFAAAIRGMRRIRPGRVTRMAPYHVIQATVAGQRAFFDRLGLRHLAYEVSEVAWPAPGHLSFSIALRPRLAALFALRRLSQGISALNPGAWGNRYFYVGEASSDAGL
jgi:SAM-dependent methyltransferase